jgi:RNA-directed DNA polymerase
MSMGKAPHQMLAPAGRVGGRSMSAVIELLRRYVFGWKAYFGLAQTPKIWCGPDEWMRRRMGTIQLKQW